jgi:DNA-binding HxlR family transcriptional regulator
MARTYGDRCGIARALDVVGERWALLIVRELVLGPKRFTDLRTGLPRIGPDVLSQRLRELEEAGVVIRDTLPPPAASKVYALTARGRELEPVLHALGRWGAAQPVADDVPMGPDALMVALGTMFDPARADGVELEIGIVIGPEAFTARVHHGRLDLSRGAAGAPDAAVTADVPALAEAVWRGGMLPDTAVTGDRRALKRFLGLFAAPSA